MAEAAGNAQPERLLVGLLMPTHVLDQDAPGLAARLRSLKAENQHKGLVKAALFAAENIPGLDAKTQTLLDDMRFRDEHSSQKAAYSMHLSEAADDRYLTLQEQGAAAEEWRQWLSLARLLRGIAIGFGAAPKEDIPMEFMKPLDPSTIQPVFLGRSLPKSVPHQKPSDAGNARRQHLGRVLSNRGAGGTCT